MSRTFHLIATAAFGLEKVVANELRHLGFEDLTTENGLVRFTGDENAIAKCNLNLRVADRLLIEVGRFEAKTFDQLFEGVKALPWEDYIPKDAAFPVKGKCVSSQLMSVPDCQAITKKAVVSRLSKVYGITWFEETKETYQLEVGLLKDMATVTIDCSGAGLHKRGYRPLTAQAPLRETLAAALVLLNHWHPDRTLWDPLCGSGTIAIEAAMIGRHIAPGLDRSFAAEDWRWMDESVFRTARSDALDAIDNDRELHIMATDIDASVLSYARFHAKNARVLQDIHFQQQDVADIRTQREYGMIITNPPYAVRMGNADETAKLYRTMNRAFSRLPNWGYSIISAYPDFERAFGKRADKKRKLYNGKLQCRFYQYLGPKPPWLTRSPKD